MKLYYDKRLKDPTYYAQQGYRIGKKTTTKNVKNFGKHSELLKSHPDPLAYVKEEILKMNEEYRVGKTTFTLDIDFNKRIESSDAEFSDTTLLNIGYFFLQDIMKGLNLKEFFKRKSSERKITFDCYTISRFLTYARILDPASKLSFVNSIGSYYEKPEFDYQHILRFMDLLAGNDSEYLSWLYNNSKSIVNRDSSVLYYDCTNFYFETEQPDEDGVDEVTGEIIPGIRKYGVSKEHCPNPIVEMGLFMDRQGIPITMSLHPGNTNEQVTAVPLEEEVIKMLGNAKFIYCADGGLGSYGIRKFNSMGGRAFIVTQSIKKLSETLKQAVFNDYDYRLLSNNKAVTIKDMKEFDPHVEEHRDLYNDSAYKVVPADRIMDLGLYETKVMEDGSERKVKATGLMKQRLIITFSRKMLEYQRGVRNRQIERARRILEKKDPEEIKKGPNDVRRFMKRVANTDSGEKATVSYEIDEAKIAEEEKYDGYYAVATNLEDPAADILAISHKRYQIEDCFRIMKTNFSGRPVNHRLPERIKAHFLICYTALLVYRLLETKLDMQGTHVTPQNLIKTLQNMNVSPHQGVYYQAHYTSSKALDALNDISDLQLNFVHYRPKDLNKKIKKILT